MEIFEKWSPSDLLLSCKAFCIQQIAQSIPSGAHNSLRSHVQKNISLCTSLATFQSLID